MHTRAAVGTRKTVERIEKTVNEMRDLAVLAPAATSTNDTQFTAANAPSLSKQLECLGLIANIRYDAIARDALRAGVSKYALQPGQMRYFNEKPIGRGSFSVVHRVRYRKDGGEPAQIYAAKV
jgi:predicted pyridoxine 5'-phosphate oxidase superfamily flavin-nucleotide-binding protein